MRRKREKICDWWGNLVTIKIANSWGQGRAIHQQANSSPWAYLTTHQVMNIKETNWFPEHSMRCVASYRRFPAPSNQVLSSVCPYCYTLVSHHKAGLLGSGLLNALLTWFMQSNILSRSITCQIRAWWWIARFLSWVRRSSWSYTSLGSGW